MSRIGKKPVALPQGVEVTVKGDRVHVKGPKGALDLDLPRGIAVSVEGGTAKVARTGNARQLRAFHGLMRSLLNNMVTGVSQGFEKRLNIIGVGYTARVVEQKVILNVGFCHTVEIPIPEGIKVEMPPRVNTLIITGADRQQLGQFAANIRRVRPPEPYKGKGIRYEDEFIRRKAGKSVVGGAT